MRILIDEWLDWRLCRSLPGHTCSSVQKMGWGGLANGALLRRAESQFDVFITGDRNLAFQQAPGDFDIAVLILHAHSIQLPDTVNLMPRVLEVLADIEPGLILDIYP